MRISISNKIKLENADEIIAQVLADELTTPNPVHSEAINAGRSTYGINEVIKNFTVDAFGNYYLPRGYIDRLLDLSAQLCIDLVIDDQRSLVEAGWPEHIIMPRGYQYDALTGMGNHPNGLLISPAGSGKTIMGIGLALMSGQKTLWITHTKTLAAQSTERFYDMVPNAVKGDVGFIGSGKWDIGNLVTVALVQTLVRNPKKLESLKNEFGTILVDECHHVPSTTFTEVIASFNPYFLYGLTATEKRRDGLQNLLFQNIGPIRYIVPRSTLQETNDIITPDVMPVFLETKGIVGDSYAEILESLMYNEERNEKIVSDVVEEAKKGHICILTTERREHADILFALLKKAWPKSGIATGAYNQKHIDGTLKLFANGELTVLVTTTHLLGEGFDHKPLNRLFVGLPFRNATKCEQIVGRIQRTSDGKICAVIRDYVDNTNGLTKHQYRNTGHKGCRYNVYKRLGCSFI